ncbi:toxin-antitoxin system HicB family antitoxin [Phyllobacterium sp. SB3]|uniref:toxin-antitoxin system HicB family antitoxin n=1 Tax=Phyllobacterium sp. SB3 TaxID=3156073 RepID=UPI0032AF9BFC
MVSRPELVEGRTTQNGNAKRLPWLDGYGRVDELLSEGRKSLKVFLEMCAEKNIHPFREFSGRFNVRLAAEVHEAAVFAAAAENKSLNEWVAEAIEAAARAA